MSDAGSRPIQSEEGFSTVQATQWLRQARLDHELDENRQAQEIVNSDDLLTLLQRFFASPWSQFTPLTDGGLTMDGCSVEHSTGQFFWLQASGFSGQSDSWEMDGHD